VAAVLRLRRRLHTAPKGAGKRTQSEFRPANVCLVQCGTPVIGVFTLRGIDMDTLTNVAGCDYTPETRLSYQTSKNSK